LIKDHLSEMMVENQMDTITQNLADLLFQEPSPADAKAIPPPVETRVQKLPFNELTWERFEQLCAHIVTIDENINIVHCHSYGVPGEKQKGIDLFAERQLDDRVELWCFQCKKRRKFNPGLLRKTLDQITFKADRYVVIIACDATRVLRDMVQKQPNTELWDAEDLSIKLKDQHDIVEDFFGVAWRRAFCGPRRREPVARKPVEVSLDYDLFECSRQEREELQKGFARLLNIAPDQIVIKMVIEDTVRIVLELPAPQAEELLSMYRQQDPRLSEVIERFRIVKIEDLKPPSEPPEPGEPGPTGPEGTPGPPISEETVYICEVCDKPFTLDKQERIRFSMSGVGLVPRTLPVRCKRHRQVRGQQATTLGRRNFDIPSADSGQGCFQCFTMADLPEVASWGTTRFSWEPIVPDEPVDSPNVVKFEIDYQVAGVLALEETDD
jgi:hypothetical protein